MTNVSRKATTAVPDIDTYIEAQREEIRPMLRTIRATIRAAAPEVQERIAWRMPTFWQDENLVHFAAFKDHIGIFPGGEYTAQFPEKLTGYVTTKGSIHLPYDQPVDTALIADIVKWRLEQVRSKS